MKTEDALAHVLNEYNRIGKATDGEDAVVVSDHDGIGEIRANLDNLYDDVRRGDANSKSRREHARKIAAWAMHYMTSMT